MSCSTRFIVSMRRAHMGVTLALALSAFMSGVASADTAAINFTSGTETVDNFGPFGSTSFYVLGDKFGVGSQSLSVTSLGVQDVAPGTDGAVLGTGLLGATGDSASSEVGIWDINGNLLASTTVDNSDAADSQGYRYATISPITLDANTQYYLGAEVGGDIRPNYADSSAGPAAYSSNIITLLENTYSASEFSLSPATAALAFLAPTTDGTDTLGRWGPANFLVSDSVPLPASATAGLVLIGALGALKLRRQIA